MIYGMDDTGMMKQWNSLLKWTTKQDHGSLWKYEPLSHALLDAKKKQSCTGGHMTSHEIVTRSHREEQPPIGQFEVQNGHES